jgi:transketolase
LGWERYAQRVVGLNRFGASAPFADVYSKLGFTKERVAAEVKAMLGT